MLVMLPTAVWAQLPAGSEFQVNAYTTGSQGLSSVAPDGNGFVVVWTGQDGAGGGVSGRRISTSGAALGSEFQVNSYTTGDQVYSAVASDANGDFVVVWFSNGQDGSGYGIFGQRFDASAVHQGAEFRVNSYTTGNQKGRAVASSAAGDFVVVWGSSGQDGSGYGVFGQRFDAAGARQGAEFQVNSYTTGNEFGAGVASDASGDFVVVWISLGQDGSGYGVFGRRFDSAGTPQASEFRVNSYTTGGQIVPRVASDPSGNFVVVWQSGGQDGSLYGVFGQRFDASGTRQGAEFEVNSYTTNSQQYPSVTMDENGHFVVVWMSFAQDGNSNGIFGRRFDATGTPVGTEFMVNSHTTGAQDRPVVAANPDGDFVVAWESCCQDGSLYGIFGQGYGDLIFEDGFDSIDLSRWSAASTDGADLSVSGAAAMAGTTAGLQAFVNDTNALFVEDDTPNAESRYRARFYFDTNGFDPGEASSHFRTRIFIAFDDSGLRLITLVLKRQGGAYSVEGRARLDDGTRADTGFFPIADGPHFFEFDWIRSDGPGVANGEFTLRIDGAIVSTLADMNNDANAVDFVRMGALSIKAGASGTMFFDQFESRRKRLIGAE